MTRLTTSRALTAINDFFDETEPSVRGPLVLENEIRLYVNRVGGGQIEARFVGENLSGPFGTNPSGRVTSVTYLEDGEEYYRLEGFSATIDEMVSGLTHSVGVGFLMTGDDQLVGSRFDDLLAGFSGNDLIEAGFGADAVDGGDGADSIFGGGGADGIAAGDGDDLIFGGPGGDEVIADVSIIDPAGGSGSGDDTVYGEGGRDTIEGGGGDDFLHGGGSRDRLNGGAGDDTLIGDRGKDKLYGGEGDDSLNGGAIHDTLEGGAGDDMLQGAKGGDRLFGGVGDDTLQGGRGLDHLYGGDGSDLFVFRRGDGNDRVHDFKPGEDLIDLSRVREIDGFDDLMKNHISGASSGAIISVEGGSIRLVGVDADALSADDFIF